MADQLLTGTTLVEKESRSFGDVPVGGIVEYNEESAYTPALPSNFVRCDGQTLSDPLSVYNGQTIPNLNTESLSVSAWGMRPGSDTYAYNTANGTYTANGTITVTGMQLNIPNGAIITEAKILGSSSSPSWNLTTYTHAGGGGTVIANANINTADTASVTVDNSANQYFFQISALTIGQTLTGGYVTYTVPADQIKVMRVK